MGAAVVLSGGGAKGSYQVGVLQRLVEKKIGLSAFYGTSVGALNSVGMAYIGSEKLTELWLKIKGIDDILKKHFFLTLPWRSGLYSMEPLKNKLAEVIQGSPIADATVCYVDLMDGSVGYMKNRDVTPEKFRKYVLASASIPFAMEPVDGHLADGGVREQAPLRKAIQDGHTDIFVVMCNPIAQNPADKFIPSFPKLLSNGLRALDVMEHEVMLNDIEECLSKNEKPGYKKINLKVYAPPVVPMDTLEFNPAKIREAIAMGRESVV